MICPFDEESGKFLQPSDILRHLAFFGHRQAGHPKQEASTFALNSSLCAQKEQVCLPLFKLPLMLDKTAKFADIQRTGGMIYYWYVWWLFKSFQVYQRLRTEYILYELKLIISLEVALALTAAIKGKSVSSETGVFAIFIGG